MVLSELRSIIYLVILVPALCIIGCSRAEVTPDRQTGRDVTIFPDYTGVTVAPNMVAPRFWIPDSCAGEDAQAVFTAGDAKVVINAQGHEIGLTESQWKSLKEAADTVSVTIAVLSDGTWSAYNPFEIYIAGEPVDPYIAYRWIEPGYESWNEMGIYQRSLGSYDTDAVITNRETDFGCMNCHSFCQQNPDKWLMHLRVDYAGTYFIDNGEITKINTKTPQTISALVYPSWHPSGRYVAFSVNSTNQVFHTTDPNRIEVYDNASDVVVYDVEKHQIVSAPQLSATGSFETFPTFSADGRRLYFCTADSVKMPDDYKSLKYSICSVTFDPDTRSFGEAVDTLYNAMADDHSASFPRVSPDGKHLMFTRASYGTFSIWHRDADLYMADLCGGEIRPLTTLNSPEAESYHSWSSNGRWVVYSSRRLDGLYTRPYIAYIDSDGNARKPLLLPPPSEDYYDLLMKSYNIPEFVTGKITTPPRAISDAAKTDPGIDATYVSF